MTKNYSYKGVDMLVAAATIAKTFADDISELSLVRANWTQEYAVELKDRIDGVIDRYLGVDKKKDLKNATAELLAIQVPAKNDVIFLKTQIEVDFPEGAEGMLNALGYGTKWQSVQRNNQEALIQLLYAFKKGMTDELKAQIVAKGTNPDLIERIVAYADVLKDAELKQEGLKISTKLVSEEAQEAFNGVYEEVIGICKIASAYYRNDDLKKLQYTFKKVVRAMSVKGKRKEVE